MNQYQQKYLEELKKLNPQQLDAVNTIEGPVMVIAGAGTGKTQTIALRIANILDKTQTTAASILCLTFTESAAINMRDRLLDIIGPLAYQIKIATFHSFCNELIKTYPDNFLTASNLEPLDDLTRVQTIKEIIEQLPDGALLKPWGDHSFYQKEIESNIQKLKRENISPSTLEKLISDVERFLDAIAPQYDQLVKLRLSKSISAEVEMICQLIIRSKNTPLPLTNIFTYQLSLHHQGFYRSGPAKNESINFKNSLIRIIDGLAKDLPRQKELLDLYRNYQKRLKEGDLYDYEDMILFVNRAFEESVDFLQIIQEKYQYILVDEYQDTNSAQNKILSYLSSHFDRPNVFVVGDDDQSIFRFQGAAIENIFSFYQKYQPKVIVLRNNYRSHQLILDTSSSVISHNQNRITQYIKDIDKSLKSSVTADPDPINLTEASSTLVENYLIVQKIKELISRGVPASEIAVLYRQNSDAFDLADLLKKESINYSLLLENNVLEIPTIRQLLSLFKLINDPADNYLFYQVLSANFTNLKALSLYRLTTKFKKNHKNYLELSLSSKSTKLKNIATKILKAKKWSENLNSVNFFNKVIRRFGILDYILNHKNPSLLSGLNTIYGEVKKLTAKNNYKFDQVLNYFSQLQENSIPLIDHQNITNDGVKLSTVHRAKGLEFQHVFIIKVYDGKWGNNRVNNSLRLPPGILDTEIFQQANDPNEEERRLFYVALTRAKAQIYLSYSTTNDAGRAQLPSVFISEINPKLIQKVETPTTNTFSSALTLQFSNPPISSKSADLKKYLRQSLSSNYVLSVSDLNSYLRCPFCFYHKSILNIPIPKEKFSSFGTATHTALTYLHHTLKKQNILISSSQLVDSFHQALRREQLESKDYKEALIRGQENLIQYYSFYQSTFHSQVLVDYNFKNKHLHLGDIPITGRIDLVDLKDKDNITVVDFKTSNPDGKYKELSESGDYFRQLAFYILLTQLDPQFSTPASVGIIDFVQKSKQKNSFVKRTLRFTPDQLDQLKRQISQIYHQILELDFYHVGPDCHDDLGVHHLLG